MTNLPSTFYWLLLQRAGFTMSALRRLAASESAAGPEQWLSWSPTRLRSFGVGDAAIAAVDEWHKRGVASAIAQHARRDQDWLDAQQVMLVSMLDPVYPPLLLEIADPPPVLYVWGDVDCLAQPQLAIVGSRRPTAQGCRDANDFGSTLAQAGFVITSGLALGIDAAAHRAALEAGGKTIAVLGHGIDRIYPAQHRELAEAVRQHGALITEFPLGTPPKATHFPSRNRIISGLSVGVLVVEAALKSGSLVTARLAAEQNREVFALPGSIHNPVSRGCNALLKSGATLVQGVEDILNELHGWTSPSPLIPPSSGSTTRPIATITIAADQRPIYDAVGFQPTPLDIIIDRAQQPLPAILVALAELELAGLIENRAGNYLRCADACVAPSA